MRCSTCGLPLSPARTSCPRCGTAIAKGSEGQAANYNIPSGRGFTDSGMQPGVQPPQQQWDQQGVPIPWNVPGAQGAPFAQPMTPAQQPGPNVAQVPFPTMNDAQMPFPVPNTPMPYPLQTPQMPEMPQTPQPMQAQEQWNQAQQYLPAPGQYSSAPWSQVQPSPFPQPPQTRLMPPPQKRSPKTGLTVAGLFVFSGALLLVLVFFLSQSLVTPPQKAPPTAQQQTTATSTSNTSPTATQAATPDATAAASPTASYPGQQYIDAPQMASGVNRATAQPTQLATTFNAGHTAYVTFTLHPGASGGAVCLLWFNNNRQVSQFAFAVSPSSTPVSAYSFANTKTAGPAYVELYWASTTSCSDKMLAQHVDFTVQ